MIKSLILRYIFISLLVLVGIVGIWSWVKMDFFTSKKVENTTVILEKIKMVTKLISVEGQFSELYDYKESYEYDFLNLFSKKILLRITAKVSCGYDFDKVNISIDSVHKKLILNELPEAEILAVDHDIDYYDISEGTFNRFTAEEYNAIQKKAKAYIASKATSAQLLEAAEKQKNDYLKMIEMALRSGGWTFEIKGAKPLLN